MRHFLISLTIIFVMASPLLRGDTVEELMRKGDAAYARRGEAGMAADALSAFREALRLAPGSFEAMVKSLQAMYFIGDHAGGRDEKQKLFKEGMDLSRKATALLPDRVEGHYWLGVHTGSYGEARGVLKSLFLKNDIIRAMERAIAIDGAYEHAGAHCVLGRLYFKVPGMFGGSKKKSRQYLERCRAIAPKSSVCLLFLAETYWSLGEKDLAVKTLEELLAMEPDPQWIPESEKDKTAGRALLRKYTK